MSAEALKPVPSILLEAKSEGKLKKFSSDDILMAIRVIDGLIAEESRPKRGRGKGRKQEDSKQESAKPSTSDSGGKEAEQKPSQADGQRIEVSKSGRIIRNA